MQPATQQPRIPRVWPFKRIFYGWAIVGAATSASFGMVPMFGPVLGVFFSSIQAELGWDRTTMSFAFTLGSASSGLFTFLIGRMLDKYGARMVVVATGVIIALAMVGLGNMQEPWQFWLAFGVGRGSALAGIQVGTSVALANWFIRQRGRTQAIKQSGLRAGQAVYPMMIFAIMAVWGWREAFLVLAGLTLLLIVLPSWMYLRRRPEDLGLYPDGADRPLEEGRAPRSRLARHVHDVSWTLAEARRTRAFWLLLFVIVVDRFALGAINIHLVINFEDRGLSQALAVSVLSIFAATSAVTGVPWGLVFERLHVRVGAMLTAGLLFLSVLVLLVADNYALAVAFALLFGVAVGASSLIENLLYAEYFGRQHLGAIRGFGAPFRIISPIGPTLTGFLFDRTGSYTVPFLVFAGIFALMFVAMAFAEPPKKPVASEEVKDEEGSG